MHCVPFLRPEKHRDPLIDKGSEVTSAFFIRLASLYPDVQEGWRYNLFGAYQILTVIAAAYYGLAYMVAIIESIQWMDFELIGETLCFGIITFVSIMVFIVYTINRGYIDRLLRAAGEGTYVYERPMTAEELEIKKSTEKEANDYGKKAFGVPLTVCIVQLVIVPLQYGLRGKYTSITNGTAPINKYSPLPVWVPYEAHDAESFFILFPFQMFPGFIEFFVIHAGITFFVGCSCVLTKHLKLLLSSLRDMYDRALYIYEKRGNADHGRKANFLDPMFQGCMRDCLRENIIHHNSIIKFFGHFQCILGWSILAIFLGAAVQISTPPYTIVKVAQMGDPEKLFTTGTIMVCHAVLSLFLTYKYCKYGQQIIDLSDEILMTYYETPWQECDIKFRRMLIVAMSNSQTPLLPAAQVIGVPASMATLLDLVKQAYSLFNLLLTAE